MSSKSSGSTRAGSVTPCARSTELKAYLDGELPAIARWTMGRHVAQCSACRAEADRFRAIGEAARESDDALPRRELRVRILASLPEPPPSPVYRTAPRPVPFRAVATGALSLATALCFALLYRQSRQVAPNATVVSAPSDLHARPRKHHAIVSRPSAVVQRPDAPGKPVTAAVPDDPEGVNKAADELFREREVEAARQEQQEQADRSGSRPMRLATGSDSAPLRLVLVARDPQRTRTTVLSLMQEAGGRFIGPHAVTAPAGHWPGVPTASASAATTVPQPEIVCVVLASRAEALVGSLQRLGSVTRLPGESAQPAPTHSIADAVPDSAGVTSTSEADAGLREATAQREAGSRTTTATAKASSATVRGRTAGHSSAPNRTRPKGGQRYVMIAVRIVAPQG